MTMLREPKRLRGVKKVAHNRAPKQEKSLAGRLGGNAVKGSGSGFEKGDVRVHKLSRIEAKCTEKKSFSVTREMVRKIEDAALGSGEVPGIVIEFLDPKGKPEHEVAVVPTWVLEMFLGKNE